MPRLGRRPTVRGMSSSHTSPPIRRILTLPLRNLHYSPNSLAEPAKGKLCVQPTFVSFPLLSWELPACFDCLREGRTIRGEGDDQRRGATLDPCCFAPWSIGTLPPQLITPGKPPPFPGEPITLPGLMVGILSGYSRRNCSQSLVESRQVGGPSGAEVAIHLAEQLDGTLFHLLTDGNGGIG